MNCCGVVEDGPEDWRYSNWFTNNTDKVPQSCCADLVDHKNYSNPTARDPAKCYEAAFNKNYPQRYKLVNPEGCEKKLDDWFMSKLSIFIIGTVVIIVTQLVIVIMACVLKSSIKSSNYEHI